MFSAFLGAVFLLKLIVVLQLRDHPLVQPEAGLDTTAYVNLARTVLAGNIGLGPGLYYVSPFYIYFLAGVLTVWESFTAVRVLQILLGTASVAFTFFTARAWCGGRAAWLAASLAALTGLFTFYESLILQASVDAFLTSSGLLALTMGLARTRSHEAPADHRRTLRTRNPRTWVLVAGVVFGIQTLNRPNVLLAVAGIAALLVATRRVRLAVVLVAGLLAGIAPAGLRNLIVANQWSLVSSHGGLNFYIGNGPAATGFYRIVEGITPTIEGQEEDARRVAESATGRPLTDAQVSDYFFGLAWSWIRQHPGAATRLFLKKFAYVFSAQHIALPHSYPFYVHDAGTILPWLPVGPWLLVPLGLVGLATVAWTTPAAHRTEYLIWASFVPFYAAAVALFFVAERYRLPLLVPLSVGAGAAIDAAMSVAAARTFVRLVLPGTVFVVLFVLCNFRTGLNDGRWEEGLRLAQRLVILGRFDEADHWAQRIAPREPRPGATDYGIGAQLLQSNEPGRALDHLQRAQSADPGQPSAEYALGQALLASGRPEESVPYLRRGFDAGIPLPKGGLDLVLALQAAGDLAGAADAIRRITPGEQDDVEAWLRLGRLATEVRAPDAAEPFFRRAVQMQPNQASARQQFGLNLLVLGRHDEAARELGEAARLEPQNSDTLSHLAYCNLKLGRVAEARTQAERALAINPDDPLAKQLMAGLRQTR